MAQPEQPPQAQAAFPLRLLRIMPMTTAANTAATRAATRIVGQFMDSSDHIQAFRGFRRRKYRATARSTSAAAVQKVKPAPVKNIPS